MQKENITFWISTYNLKSSCFQRANSSLAVRIFACSFYLKSRLFHYMRHLLFTFALCCLALAGQAQTPTPAHNLTRAIMKNDATTAATLLTSGADPNSVIEVVPGFPTTYLITAVTNNNLDLVKLLLQHKAQINQPDSFKGTALMAAVGKGNPAMVTLLLASGADVRATDDDGKDALALAKDSGNTAIVALLAQKLK